MKKWIVVAALVGAVVVYLVRREARAAEARQLQLARAKFSTSAGVTLSLARVSRNVGNQDGAERMLDALLEEELIYLRACRRCASHDACTRDSALIRSGSVSRESPCE